MFSAHDTGMAILDAQADFRRARRASTVARVGRRLTRRTAPNAPRTIGDVPPLCGGPTRLEVVPLDSIIGTLEPTVHFDDGDYVIDGRHRVSVARALGHRDIDAWVTGDRSPAGNDVSEAPIRTSRLILSALGRACLQQGGQIARRAKMAELVGVDD